jgi:chromosome segregation ATPase
MIESSRIGEEIMARKRLSDLLREEEQKAADNPAATPPDSAKPAAKTGKAAATAAKSKPAAETAEVIADQAEQVDTFVAELRQAESASPSVEATAEITVTAELEATITQLKAELEALQKAAHHQETAYQAQIQDLKKQIADRDDVHHQETADQTQIQDLKKQIADRDDAMQQLQIGLQQMQQQAEQAKTELEEARQMILQLSQVNGKTAAPAPKPAAPKSGLQTRPVLESSHAAEPELESKPLELIMPTAKPKTDERPKLHQLELRKLLDHPTQPGQVPEMPPETKPTEQPVKLTDTDVGWMD